jgi:hypothetical protein
MCLILDRIAAARQREFAGRDFLSDRCRELCHCVFFFLAGHQQNQIARAAVGLREC